MENIKVMFSSEKSDWSTPQDFYDELDREFHFDIDFLLNKMQELQGSDSNE